VGFVRYSGISLFRTAVDSQIPYPEDRHFTKFVVSSTCLKVCPLARALMMWFLYSFWVFSRLNLGLRRYEESENASEDCTLMSCCSSIFKLNVVWFPLPLPILLVELNSQKSFKKPSFLQWGGSSEWLCLCDLHGKTHKNNWRRAKWYFRRLGTWQFPQVCYWINIYCFSLQVKWKVPLLAQFWMLRTLKCCWCRPLNQPSITFLVRGGSFQQGSDSYWQGIFHFSWL